MINALPWRPYPLDKQDGKCGGRETDVLDISPQHSWYFAVLHGSKGSRKKDAKD